MPDQSPDRAQATNSFLAGHNWKPEHRSLLADDASFRSYDRLIDGDRRAVLMNAPPPHEDVRPFIHIANHLKRIGLRSPEIYASDVDLGFLLLEDFGDNTYTRILNSSPDQEQTLYELAVDVLIYLHKLPDSEMIPDNLDIYSLDFYQTETQIFTEWYLPHILDQDLPPEAVVSYQAVWRELFEFVLSERRCLVLRDFHVDNLVLLDGSAGLNSCGLLDFQGALLGARTYDLMSLLEDARRDLPDQLVTQLKSRYYAAFPELSAPGPARNAFDASYAILGAGRHAKVIGIFTRLCFRDAKPDYLVHIPRVWKLLERSLKHPMLGALEDWFDTYVPKHDRVVPQRFAKENK